MSKLSSYETIMVISVKNGDEAANAIVEKFKTLISGGGTIDSIDEWGKRRLAYTINDEVEGLYVLVNFTATPDFSAELDRVYKITDGVLRSLIIAK
ncbi:MAG: 30S ribosomal protein S6 [Angelakisella sp.]